MPELKIHICGLIIELCIHTITDEQQNQLRAHAQRYLTELEAKTLVGWDSPFSLNQALQVIWYYELEKMRDIMGQSGWNRLDRIGHYKGLSFYDQNDITLFFNDVIPRPFIEGIYVDDRQISFNPAKISRRYHPPQTLPTLSQGEVFVYHGVVDRRDYDYFIHFSGRFDEKKLIWIFDDCGKYGYILRGVEYGGNPMVVRGGVRWRKLKLELNFSSKSEFVQ